MTTARIMIVAAMTTLTTTMTMTAVITTVMTNDNSIYNDNGSSIDNYSDNNKNSACGTNENYGNDSSDNTQGGYSNTYELYGDVPLFRVWFFDHPLINRVKFKDFQRCFVNRVEKIMYFDKK